MSRYGCIKHLWHQACPLFEHGMQGFEMVNERKGSFQCGHREDGDNKVFKDEHHPWLQHDNGECWSSRSITKKFPHQHWSAE